MLFQRVRLPLFSAFEKTGAYVSTKESDCQVCNCNLPKSRCAKASTAIATFENRLAGPDAGDLTKLQPSVESWKVGSLWQDFHRLLFHHS